MHSAALQAYRDVAVLDVLEGVPVSHLMHSEIPSVPPHTSVATLVNERIMGTGNDRNDHAFSVVQEKRLLGIVCLEDIHKVPKERWDSTSVADIMTPFERLGVVSPDDETTAAISELARRDVNQLPVVREGRLLGMLRRRDILKWLQAHSEQAT